jgi:exonuclease VII small subunit
MATSDDMNRHAEKVATEYQAHLEQAEDHLQAAAQNAEKSFTENTAGADAHLEQAEDHLEAAAQNAEKSFTENPAGAEAHLEQAEDHLEAAAQKAQTPR